MNSSSWMKGICLAVSMALLAGCAGDNKKQAAAKSAAAQEAINSKYVGRHKDVLIKDKGLPPQTMDVTLMGRPASEAYLYKSKEGTCTDSFVVVEETGMVIDYFCR